jgi:hypothetical protein
MVRVFDEIELEHRVMINWSDFKHIGKAAADKRQVKIERGERVFTELVLLNLDQRTSENWMDLAEPRSTY